VAYDFDEAVLQHKIQVGVRKYTTGVRPAQSFEWNNVKLVKYSFNSTTGKIDFGLVN
jgi:hypothetical protein